MYLSLCLWIVSLIIVIYVFYASRYVETKKQKKRKRHALFWNVTSYAICSIVKYYYKHIFKETCMTSRQKGEDLVHEILNDHMFDVWMPLEWNKIYLDNYVKTYNQNIDYKQVKECKC